jgi:hypothetical protein
LLGDEEEISLDSEDKTVRLLVIKDIFSWMHKCECCFYDGYGFSERKKEFVP